MLPFALNRFVAPVVLLEEPSHVQWPSDPESRGAHDGTLALLSRFGCLLTKRD